MKKKNRAHFKTRCLTVRVITNCNQSHMLRATTRIVLHSLSLIYSMQEKMSENLTFILKQSYSVKIVLCYNYWNATDR